MSETIMVPIQDQQSAYQHGLAEGFRRGVQAAADLVANVRSYRDPKGFEWPGSTLASVIRALRPEGETK